MRKVYSQAEVEYQILELYPELKKSDAGWLLWNKTCFPFSDGEDDLVHWLGQIEKYLAGETECENETS